MERLLVDVSNDSIFEKDERQNSEEFFLLGEQISSSIQMLCKDFELCPQPVEPCFEIISLFTWVKAPTR